MANEKLLPDYEEEIGDLIKDGAGIIPLTKYKKLLLRGLEVYSRKKPLDVVLDLAGDGTGDFAVSDLTGFDENISGDPQIEFPIAESGEENLIDRRDWKFVRKPTGLFIRLLSSKPTEDEEVRFSFKGVHQVTDSASTVPDSDFFALSKLSAAEGCDDLAQHYTNSNEGVIVNADFAQYKTKRSEYEARAKTYRAQADKHFGVKDDSTPAASVTKNWDTTNSRGGDRLTHPRRFR